MTPQQQAIRARREAAALEEFALLPPDQQLVAVAVAERMATAGGHLEDALEDVTGVREIAHLATWTI